MKINLNLPFDFQRVVLAKVHEKEPPHFFFKRKVSKYFLDHEPTWRIFSLKVSDSSSWRCMNHNLNFLRKSLKKKIKSHSTSWWQLTGYPIEKLESEVGGVWIGVEVKQHWTGDGDRGQDLIPTHGGKRCGSDAGTPDDVHAIIVTASCHCWASCAKQGTSDMLIRSNINGQCVNIQTKM